MNKTMMCGIDTAVGADYSFPTLQTPKKTKVINFFGQPGAGKSTLAADTFATLKRRGINCELVNEYAKAVTWRKAQPILTDQLYVFAKQYNYQHRLIGQVDYIITDSPLILSLFYGVDEGTAFEELVRCKWRMFDNINFFVRRTKEYNPNGRNQTEKQSDEIAEALLKILLREEIDYTGVTSDTTGAEIWKAINATTSRPHSWW